MHVLPTFILVICLILSFYFNFSYLKIYDTHSYGNKEFVSKGGCLIVKILSYVEQLRDEAK